MIFQIGYYEIEHTHSLNASDLGKWCYIFQGTYQGFHNTQYDAMMALREMGI
jgi:hypothetical protein